MGIEGARLQILDWEHEKFPSLLHRIGDNQGSDSETEPLRLVLPLSFLRGGLFFPKSEWRPPPPQIIFDFWYTRFLSEKNCLLLKGGPFFPQK